VYTRLSGQLDAHLQKLTATLKTDLPRVNAALKREKIAPVDPNQKPVEAPAKPGPP
jgi:hypothetical protein